MMRWMIMAFGMLAAAPAAAQVTFDAPFTDHAVLQRDRAIAVHGHAPPKAEIELSFAGATVRAAADAKGAWRAILPAVPAGGPYPSPRRAAARARRSAMSWSATSGCARASRTWNSRCAT